MGAIAINMAHAAGRTQQSQAKEAVPRAVRPPIPGSCSSSNATRDRATALMIQTYVRMFVNLEYEAHSMRIGVTAFDGAATRRGALTLTRATLTEPMKLLCASCAGHAVECTLEEIVEIASDCHGGETALSRLCWDLFQGGTYPRVTRVVATPGCRPFLKDPESDKSGLLAPVHDGWETE